MCILSVLWNRPRMHHCLSCNPFCLFVQTPPPAPGESSRSDTADLLGLNCDPDPSAMSSISSQVPHQGDEGGLKAASSNSDLLNDLFAPPAGQTGAGQEDLFFSEPTSGATPDSKRNGKHFIGAGCINIKSLLLFFPSSVFVLQLWVICLIHSGWGPALVLAPASVHLDRPLDQICLETCWALIVQQPADLARLTVTPPLRLTPASSTSVSPSFLYSCGQSTSS